MRTRHTVIESPLGEMTLVADGDTLTGVYFRQHWHPPTADALGDCVVPATDEVFRSAAVQLHEYLAGDRTQFELPMALVGRATGRPEGTALSRATRAVSNANDSCWILRSRHPRWLANCSDVVSVATARRCRRLGRGRRRDQ